jgi:uncharacterized protein
MSLPNVVRARAAAFAASASLVAAIACSSACRRGASGDRPAALGPASSVPQRHQPSPAQPSPPPPPIPRTCWGGAKTPEERDVCAEAEFQTADRDLNSVYARALTNADPNLHQAVRSAERAWLRYRDTYLASLAPVASGPTPQVTTDHCRPILLARVTRGRVAELTRMLARADPDSQAVEASCEGPPPECEQARKWLEAAYRKSAGSGRPAVRARLDASQDAWLAYLAAQTAAVLASQQPSEPSQQTRLRESVRVRLSVDRIAHLAMFDGYRQNMDERCQQLQAESRMLAELEAKCESGRAGDCTSLGQALEWGWYSIDRDRPHARALYQKACDLGDGTACNLLAGAVSTGRGVAKDPAKAARFLQRGCDAGDAVNCERLALVHAKGEGVPRDIGRALALWQHACDLSDSDKRSYWSDGQPCQNLARALESGDRIPQDLARALAFHEDACEKKRPGGCVAAARLLRKQGGFDASRVISLYKKGCSGYQSAEACVELGDLYRHGNGIPQDREAALEWYRSACTGGFVPGCRAVSELTGAPMGDPDDRVSDPGFIRTVRFVAAEDVPPLRLRLFGDAYGTVTRLQVFDEGERRATQEITVPESPGSEPGAKLPLGQVDFNFDGYKDLTLRHFEGANNYGDFIWIFDSERRRFVYSPELSDLPNLQLDPEHRVITSYYHFSAGEGAVSQYKWLQGKAVLVREDTRYMRKEGANCLEQVTRELVRGRLVETERSCQ